MIAVSGELDLDTAPQLEDRLDSAGNGVNLLLDLSGCEFIDSTGISLIVRSWQQRDADPKGNGAGRFALCGLSDQVRRLLEITGISASMQIYRERDEALAEELGRD